jgi:hypothetical protein
MRRVWIGLGAGLAVLLPLAAIGEKPPQVVMATPGAGGTGGGAINRYTLRFSDAMVPLGDPRAAAPAKMSCAVASAGRWVDQQTYVFEFERPLPGGITCTVELNAQLKSARGQTVTGTANFKIDTGGPSVRAVLPGEYDGDIEEDQVFLIATNTPATRASVGAAAYCAVDGIGEKIPLDVLADGVAAKLLGDLGDEHWDSRNFLENAGLPRTLPGNAAERGRALSTIAAVKCRRPLPPGRDVALVWGKSVASADGRLSGRDQRYDFTVRKAFTARWSCRRVNPQSGCNPVQDAKVEFTSDIPRAQALAIRLQFPDGPTLTPRLDDQQKNQTYVSMVRFNGPLPGATKGRLVLPADIRDESGRPLANAARFPLEVDIAAAPPLAKFAAEFGIIEANEGEMLPVTVRAVEPALGQSIKRLSGDMLRVDASDAEVARWLRRVAEHEEDDIRDETIGGKEVSVNYTGAASLLGGQGQDLKLALPAGGKEFEVVGIPLKEPGFYVVELASPALGRALLGRNQPRYVTAAALVTNMAVHFKWGREKSLAWVTTLDGAAPVAGADVRVSDSCTGRQIARGTTDKSGRLVVTGLPEPETYSDDDCDPDSAHALMISARSGGDFSFTLTDWGDGIRPYDFDLPYGWQASDDIVHTIFDRTLVKQGETVNMKHILRKPVGEGFAYAGGIKGILKLSHMGSGTSFELPLDIGSDGIGENSWDVPKGAPMGSYALAIVQGKDTRVIPGTIQVDEYRLPTMRATITGPREAQIRPVQVPLNLFVGYLSGGPAANLPVSIRTAYSPSYGRPEGWEGWTFGGRPVAEGTVPLNGDSDEPALPMPQSQLLPVTLGGDGTARAAIDIAQAIETETDLDVEMDYQDANGETLTASRRIKLYPSAIRLGIKTDGWMMRGDDLRLKLAAIDAEGIAQRGRTIRVELYSREILTARRRLIGGFYAYDNQMKTTKIAGGCTATTDKAGMAACALAPGISGEITVVATTTDSNGNVARAVESVWLAGEDDWWFGGDNGDRMDVIPEAKSYKAGEKARLQVRMPFREATALVTVEREGVLSSFVTQLSGKDPMIEVPMPASYAPNVYVSVMAVRGRIGGFKLWTAKIARDWGLPFLSKDGYEPTALVDLAKPSYRIGMAKVRVGWEGHRLDVAVKADKTRYAVRDTAQVDVAVKAAGGKMPPSTEIAFAAIDEALLQLQPNDSWDLLDAMMGERPVSVLTSTAQTQVVGKRHYGKKAVAIGGGGGADPGQFNRENFKPVLLWKGRVPLDAKGRARVAVPLVDSLSSYRLVAIANGGAGMFGTGATEIRTAQDLSLFSGLPPLVRSGDRFGASFTLRNGTDKAMTVTAVPSVVPAVANLAPQTVTIPAGGSAPVTWEVTAPERVTALDWTIEAKSGKVLDRLTVAQTVAPLVAPEIWAATLVRVGANTAIRLQAPEGALAGQGFVDVKLSDTLAPPLAGVRDYMTAYPYSCFEQQTSRLVVLGDTERWNRLAAEIPAYLDGDGLLKYWPVSDMRGSPALTAYVLSITAEAGFPIPEESRAKLLGAMKAVVDGRLKRDYAWGGDERYVRLSALAALARNGSATPAMLGQIGLAPADMPTGVLSEWLATIDRTRGANTAARAAAEAMLRQRIVYEGTRLDLTDAGNAPWWMMSSGDEMAIRALNAILGRPGWGDDEAKMMVGVALRQQRGHWDTTTANAWGAVAARKFAKLYPATAITGTTTVALGDETLTRSWPQAADAGPMRLSLPTARTPLLLKHAGAGPWAQVSLSAAVPLRAPLFAGYRVRKEMTAVQQAVKGQWSRGDVMKVRITVEAGAGRNWVVVNDPIPPGATVLGGLGGQSAQLAGASNGGEGAWPSYVERGNDSWRAYFEWAPQGRFTVEYVVRLNGTGQFNLPPTRVEAMYSPEIRGQLPNGAFAVAMR